MKHILFHSSRRRREK